MNTDSKNILGERSKIYDGIRNGCEVEVDHGIYLDLKIDDENYLKLKYAVSDYIFTTLQSFYKDKDFVKDDYLLTNYKNEILNLPNITPNGAFYPKLENVKEYNKIQSTVNDILLDSGLFGTLQSFDVCTVRVVDGDKHKYKNRVYDTTKLHSDSWVGHDGDAILTIGTLGDRETSLEFNKPVGKISNNFFQIVDSFDDGM